MNITESLIRIATLVALASLGLLLVFGEEQDENILLFLWHFLFDKALGMGCLFAAFRLYGRWSKTDTLIARFEAWSQKGLEE